MACYDGCTVEAVNNNYKLHLLIIQVRSSVRGLHFDVQQCINTYLVTYRQYLVLRCIPFLSYDPARILVVHVMVNKQQ